MAMRESSNNSIRLAVEALAFLLASFHLYTGFMGIFESKLQNGIHLLFVIPLAFLLYPATKKGVQEHIPWYDWILAFLAFLPSFYLIINKEALNNRWENVTPLTPVQLIIGVILIVTLIETVRRCASPALALLMFVAVLELAFGHLLTGTLYHSRFTFERIIETAYLLNDEGIYGYITGVSAVFVALFVVFGAFINNIGLGEYFIDLSFRLTGRSAGGPAKVAVISSALFGTISGSATANVFATGVFTIPMMKKLGYPARFAGAVEATASTGGGLVPPIMGAAVFLMAQITQIPYITLCKVAIPAAFLYYLCVFLTVHYEAKKRNIQSVETEDIKMAGVLHLVKKSYLLLPIFILVAMLLKGYSPLKGAFWGIVTSIVVSQCNAEHRMNIRRFIETLIAAGKNIVMIGCACAGAGLIVSVITSTGIGLSFSSLVIHIAGGNMLIALFLVMCSTIILGMGLPTTAAYVLTIAIGAPILTEMGGDIIAIHLFVFYFAVLAAVTPPVAMAAYAGASIADAPPMATAFEASRLAIAGYIVPYLFFFNNGILLEGGASVIAVSIAIAIIGVFFVVIALEGWMLARLTLLERIALLILAIVIPFPIYFTNTQSLILGIALFAALYLLQKRRRDMTAAKNA